MRYSPGSLNVMFVVAFPRNGGVVPAESFSIAGRFLSNVTSPGPRYLENDSVTGARATPTGAPVLLAYFMSSNAQSVNANGVDATAVRSNPVVAATRATGPCVRGPFSSKLSAGGVFPAATS